MSTQVVLKSMNYKDESFICDLTKNPVKFVPKTNNEENKVMVRKYIDNYPFVPGLRGMRLTQLSILLNIHCLMRTGVCDTVIEKEIALFNNISINSHTVFFELYIDKDIYAINAQTVWFDQIYFHKDIFSRNVYSSLDDISKLYEELETECIDAMGESMAVTLTDEVIDVWKKVNCHSLGIYEISNEKLSKEIVEFTSGMINVCFETEIDENKNEIEYFIIEGFEESKRVNITDNDNVYEDIRNATIKVLTV